MQCEAFVFPANTVPTCRPIGALGLAAACDPKASLCGPGLFCASNDPRCYKYCRVGRSPSDCTGSCQPFPNPRRVTPDGTEYGYCSMN
jgi:hypothetical protein